MGAYVVKKRRGAKKIRILVRHDGVVVTVPYSVPSFIVSKFIHANQVWIDTKVQEFTVLHGEIQKKDAERKKDYTERKKLAKSILTERVHTLNAIYGYKYGSITVRNQKTRWGSCTKSGNLSFNYAVAFLPDEIRDYVVIHELCHIQEFNHSKQFWSLVLIGSPKYREIKKVMKTLSVTVS